MPLLFSKITNSSRIRKLLFLCAVMLLPFLVHGKVTINRALVIGLGQQEDPSWAKIHGDNDVIYVTHFLEQLGYTDIKKITNQEATKEGIITALQELAQRCGSGDKVYIHYSGHGQLMTDLNGDEALKWEGSFAEWDQSWIPYDAYMHYCDNDHGEKHLCDDELAVLLSAIRKKIGRSGELIVVVDSCHSGDATASVESMNSDLGYERDEKDNENKQTNKGNEFGKKVEDSTGNEQECVRGASARFNIPRTSNLTQSSPVPEQWLTISACRPYELSTEIKRLSVGKLTYALYKLGGRVLLQNRTDMEKTLSTFLKQHQGRTPQNPMVTGRK